MKKYAVILLLVAVMNGCVLLRGELTQQFYLDGNSSIQYNETIFPNLDVLHKSFYYYEIYTDKFLDPANYVVPSIFEKRGELACELLQKYGVKCKIGKSKNKLKGENAIFEVELTESQSETKIGPNGYFKVTKTNDELNLAEMYTYEIYRIPTTLSYAKNKNPELESDMKKAISTEFGNQIIKTYGKTVCISNSTLINMCNVASNDQQNISVNIEPFVSDPFEYQYILGVECFDGSQSYSINQFGDFKKVDIEIKRGMKQKNFEVNCPSTKTNDIIIIYNQSFPDYDEIRYEKIILMDSEDYASEVEAKYGELFPELAPDLVDFEKGEIMGVDSKTLDELWKNPEFLKRTDMEINYNMKFEGIIVDAKIGNTTVLDKFDKTIMYIGQGGWEPRNSMELDLRKLIKYSKEKTPLTIVVKRDYSPFGWGSGTYVVVGLSIAIIILIIVRAMKGGFRNEEEYN